MKKTILMIALTLVASTSFAEKNAYKLNCNGTEPFWSLKINGSNVSLTSAMSSDKAVGFFDARMSEAAGVVPGTAFQINASHEKGRKKISISVISAGDAGCSDGMSDERYQYHALVNVDGVVMYGCCQ